MHLRRRPLPTDAQLGADLGGDLFPAIDHPEVVLIGLLVDAAHREPAHRHQLARERGPLGLLGITHGRKQFPIAALLEHISNSRRPTRQAATENPHPVDEFALGDHYQPEPKSVGPVR
jgi:hypothetical protein